MWIVRVLFNLHCNLLPTHNSIELKCVSLRNLQEENIIISKWLEV